jgi:hypothetical protein
VKEDDDVKEVSDVKEEEEEDGKGISSESSSSPAISRLSISTTPTPPNIPNERGGRCRKQPIHSHPPFTVEKIYDRARCGSRNFSPRSSFLGPDFTKRYSRNRSQLTNSP